MVVSPITVFRYVLLVRYIVDRTGTGMLLFAPKYRYLIINILG